jgi:hypothetical protein
MTAAEKRLDELLGRWLDSLDRHAGYLQLDDAAYARAEAWPRHQRPTAWVIELARKRLLELRAQARQRQEAGDGGFAESLELMSFLTSLLGSEHIERYIPLATGKPPDSAASGTVQQPRIRRTAPRPAAAPAAAHKRDTGRHAVARKPAPPADAPSSPPPAAPRAPARPPASHAALPPRSAPTPPQGTAPPPAKRPPDAAARQVMADAVRLLEWGREWPALAGLIARMADRPAEADVWKILRTHRAEIMTRARRRDA